MDSIKRVRKSLGLSLAEVARRAGMGKERVAFIERKGIDPRASTVARIAQALGVPVCRLFSPQQGKEDTHREHERGKRRG
jgi:transcriptional regulator with XRE-family HTH domain